MGRSRRSDAGGAGVTPGATGLLRGKGAAGGSALLLVGALLRPVLENWRPEPKDNFPLSYYPMFSLPRTDTTKVNYVAGVDVLGTARPLPHASIGVGGFNQVRRQINRAVREHQTAALCRRVAANGTLGRPGPFADVVEVRVMSGEYRLADYLAGHTRPVTERVRAACRVERETA